MSFLRSHSFSIRYITLLILICVITFAGCTKKAVIKKNVHNVYVESPIQKTVPKSIYSFGNMQSNKTVDISAQVTGIIKKIHFKEGSHIKKDDLLISIDPTEYQAQLDIDKALLLKQNEDYKLRKYMVDKNKKLAQDGVLAANDYAQLVTEMKISEAEIKVIENNIKRDEIDLKYCSIKSPIDGVVGKIDIDIGNLVRANFSQDKQLTTIRQVNPLYVDFSLPDTDYTLLRNAMKNGDLKVNVRLLQKAPLKENRVKEYSGTLKFLDNTINQETATIQLRATVNNEKFELWPGQMVRVNLILGEIKDAILIPSKAIRIGKNGKYIFVTANDNKAKVIYVKTGLVIDDKTVIQDGDIKLTDKVITVGLENLGAGSSVKIVKDLSSETSEKSAQDTKDQTTEKSAEKSCVKSVQKTADKTNDSVNEPAEEKSEEKIMTDVSKELTEKAATK
jgi:membrane fusion protein, multidrug efflux system